ncbi:hypothetical protein GW17_00014824 [Ensete ventricosum]|nr:hypothetical protein GW17_00014824 [Ensete ventricosum]
MLPTRRRHPQVARAPSSPTSQPAGDYRPRFVSPRWERDQGDYVGTDCETLQGITKPKEIRKFKGEGMPIHMSTKKGDLYLTYEVLFPKSLTEDQKTKIKAVLS